MFDCGLSSLAGKNFANPFDKVRDRDTAGLHKERGWERPSLLGDSETARGSRQMDRELCHACSVGPMGAAFFFF